MQTLFTDDEYSMQKTHILQNKINTMQVFMHTKVLFFHAVSKRTNFAGRREATRPGNVFGLVVYHDSYLLCLLLFV
jgi:hypothetical protein